MSANDAERMAGLARGEQASLEELLERYWETAYRVALRFTHDPASAEDVAQEAFVKLLHKAGRFEEGRAFRPWFFRIVENTAKSHLRARERRVRYERRAAQSEARGIGGSDDAMLVQERLEQLNPKHSQALQLHYLLGLTHEEVAGSLGIPVGTVASRLRRGLEALRLSLQPAHSFSVVALVGFLRGVSGAAPAAPLAEALLARAEGSAPMAPPAPAASALLATAVARPRLGPSVVLAVVALLAVVAGLAAFLGEPPERDPRAQVGVSRSHKAPATKKVLRLGVPSGSKVEAQASEKAPDKDDAEGSPSPPREVPSSGSKVPSSGGKAPLEQAYLEGFVRDSSRRGISGAFVELLVLAPERLNALSEADRNLVFAAILEKNPGLTTSDLYRPVAIVETTEEGHFSFAPLELESRVTWLWLRCTHPGYQPLFSRPFAVGRRFEHPLGVILAPGATIEVTLLAPDGSAPERPHVALSLQAPPEYLEKDTLLGLQLDLGSFGRATELRNEGRVAVFRGVPAGKHALRVRVPGYQTREIELDAPAFGIVQMRVLLVRGLTIRGKVVGPNGAPLSGASVWALADREFDPLKLKGLLASRPQAKTDSDGAFSLEGLDADRYNMLASAPGHALSERRVVVAGTPQPTIFALSTVSEGRLAGRAVRHDTGEPLEGVLIEISSLERPMKQKGRSTRTDPEGRFSFADLATGHHELFTGGNEQLVAKPLRVEILPGEGTVPVELRLGRGATLRVTVTDEDSGVVVSQAKVRFSRVQSGIGTTFMGERGAFGVQTDREGRAELTGLLPGQVYEIEVLHRDYMPSRSRVDLAATPASATVRITLGRGTLLRGCIVDAHGAPRPHVQVGVVRMDQSDGAFLATDSKGRFEVRLAPGTYTVMQLGLALRKAPQLHGVVLVAGETLEIEVRPLPPPR